MDTDAIPARGLAPRRRPRGHQIIGILTIILSLWNNGNDLLSFFAGRREAAALRRANQPVHRLLPLASPGHSERQIFLDKIHTVKCQASNGKLIIKPVVTGVEYDFLGLLRYTGIGRSPQESSKEDELCERLEMIGGQVYKDERSYHKIKAAQRRPLKAWLAWSEETDKHGVWIVVLDDHTATGRGIGWVENSRSMEERCRMIKHSGGEFFQDWDAIKPVLQEALSWEGKGMPDKDSVPFGQVLS
ncbi:Hypothetical protein D9617_18g032970 [Elsinoe fawcettii]|nr:Hypothetical protein D9617_18g032970 [Elsinoe fawcettii]